MTKTILITRPLSQETPLSDALHERGYRVIQEPLTEIFLLHDARPTLEYALQSDPDAIIVTSQHGVHALAALTELRDHFLICVGENTEYTAQLQGFSRTCSAGGDSQSLVDYVSAAYDQGSYFVYVSARDISTDLVAELEHLDMQVERIVVYEANAAESFSDVLIEQIKRKKIDAVTFLSQRTAGIFVDLTRQAKLEEMTPYIAAYTMSEAIADPLTQLEWADIHVSEKPTLASLIECIDTSFKHSQRM